MTTVPTAAWPADDLEQFGGADEISISTRRADGSLRPFVPIWIVAVDGNLYVRSYRGTGGTWYQHATQHPVGSIRSGDHHADVTFAPADQTQPEAIDAAYRAKYIRYGDTYLQPMLAEQAVVATLQLVPQT
jgi:hypothetical protein